MGIDIDYFEYDICVVCGHGDCTCNEDGLSYNEIQELIKEVNEKEIYND